MLLSKEGRKALIEREGKRNKAYLDTKGIPTIGIGHTGPDVFMGLVWSDAQIDWAFSNDVEWAEEEVDKVITPLTKNQYDALVSFVFNIGATAFRKSTLLKLLNQGLYEEAAKQFDRWVIPKEITGRRMSEKSQFLTKE